MKSPAAVEVANEAPWYAQGAYHAGRMPTPYGANPPQIPQREQELAQTATIRNAVNLKKATLRLVPVNGDSTKLAVTFCFDASQPARCAPYPTSRDGVVCLPGI